MRVGLALERELDRVGLLHAAFFQRVAMRVEHERAHRLVVANDLVEPRLAGEAHERQPRELDAAVEADELEMADQLARIFVVNAVQRCSSGSSSP